MLDQFSVVVPQKRGIIFVTLVSFKNEVLIIRLVEAVAVQVFLREHNLTRLSHQLVENLVRRMGIWETTNEPVLFPVTTGHDFVVPGVPALQNLLRLPFLGTTFFLPATFFQRHNLVLWIFVRIFGLHYKK